MPPTTTSTGVVLTVPTRAEARAARRAVVARDDLCVHQLRVVDVDAPDPGSEPFGAAWARTRQGCRRFPVSSAELDELDELVGAAGPPDARAIRHAIEVCTSDAGFVLVLVAGGSVRRRVRRMLPTLARVFERDLDTVQSVDALTTVSLRRPSPSRLERRLDHDLATVLVGDDEDVPAAWNRWSARESIDDHVGFAPVAPLVADRLQRLGVVDEAGGRIVGMRRRTWYANRVLERDAGEAVQGLRDLGCDPVVLDDLAWAVEASSTGAVRPVSAIGLSVRAEDVPTAAVVLHGLGWESPGTGAIAPRRVEQQTRQRYRRGPGRSLILHWRQLPQRAWRLVPPATPDSLGPIDLNGTPATVLGPTDRLVRLWARTADPEPGHVLRTLADTAFLVERDPIDWPRLWAACRHLDLVEHGELYLATLPPIQTREVQWS